MTERSGLPSGLYVRISDDREGLELGVERQEADLRNAAARAGDEVVAVYSDNDRGASTRSTKPRPEYDRLMADARAGRLGKIWAYTSSRLTRRPMEHEGQIQLAEQCGIVYGYIRSPSFDLNTANGRMVARILAAKDANESEETGERIQRAFVQKREKGEYLGGGRLFGWEADGETPRRLEYVALVDACDQILAGMSLRAIAHAWNRAGLSTSRGNRWLVTTLRQVLLRPRNAGLVVHEGQIVGKYPWWENAPLAEEVWSLMCAVLTNPERRTAAGNQPRWLGSGLYVCSGCEQPSLRVGWSASAQHRLYRCAGRVPAVEGRRHVARAAVPLDEYVEELIVARLSRDDAVDLAHDDRPGVDVRALRVERLTALERLRQLDDDLDADRIDRDRWLRRNGHLKERLAQIDAELAPVGRLNPYTGVVDADDPAVVWYGSRPDRSDGLPLAQRRAILDDLMVVTVQPVVWKNGPFDPDRIEVVWKR